MSFISIFKHIGHAVANAAPEVGEGALHAVAIADQIAEVATPLLLPMLSGPALAVEQAIKKGIDIAEAAITTAQQGAAKKLTAGAIVSAELPNAQAIIAEFGADLHLTPETGSKLSIAIDAAVAARNSIAAVLESLKPASPKA